MPNTQNVKLVAGIIYSVSILNAEMESLLLQIQNISNEMTQQKLDVIKINNNIVSNQTDLNNINAQLLAMYIKETGTFPPS